jgi:hypothetical protein
MERELLAIVETLKDLQNILLGKQIKVYTDHQNLISENFNTKCVIHWCFIIEAFGPEFNYIEGANHIVAAALSRLSLNEPEPKQKIKAVAEYYGI